MKKILIITHNVRPLSGWGRYSSNIIETLKKRNWEVDVLDEEGPEQFSLRSGGVISIIRNCLLARRAARKAGIVHALDLWPYGLYGYAAVAGTDKKLFVNGVGTYSVAPFRSWVKKMILNVVLKRAGRVFAISSYTQKRMQEFTSCPVGVVHLGLTPFNVNTSSEVADFKSKIGISSLSPVILSVGAVKNRKGQLDTLEAVGILKEKFPQIVYCMVGSGSEASYVKKIRDKARELQMEDRIKIFESVSDEKLALFYQACDIFALNSQNHQGHFEGFGLVVLEAAQYGKPAVGSMGCGIEDAIMSGVTGFLSPQSDPAGIAVAIEKALTLSDHEKISAFAESFTWGKTIEAYEKFYKDKD